MTYQNLLITTQQAEDFAKKYYGIIATAKSLPGFEDFNFRLKTNDNKTYILKISRGNTNLNILDFQTSKEAKNDMTLLKMLWHFLGNRH